MASCFSWRIICLAPFTLKLLGLVVRTLSSEPLCEFMNLLDLSELMDIMDLDYFVFSVDLVYRINLMDLVDLVDLVDLSWKAKYLDLLQQAMEAKYIYILFSNIT